MLDFLIGLDDDENAWGPRKTIFFSMLYILRPLLTILTASAEKFDPIEMHYFSCFDKHKSKYCELVEEEN